MAFKTNHHEGVALSVLGSVLAGLGVLGQIAGQRRDGREDAAGDTLFLARELEAVSAQTYDVLYDPIKGRQMVTFTSDIPDGAESWSYDFYDGFGVADWVTNWASVIGGADAFKTRTVQLCYSFGSSYSYTVQDLAAAAFAATGRSLDRERARRARLAHEYFLDNLVAVGDTTRGIIGITNASAIPTVTRGGGHAWTDSNLTTADIHKDLTKLSQAPEQASTENFVADTLALPLSMKPLLSQPYSTLNGDSILKVWLAGQESIKRVIFWKRLNTASAASGVRALAYKNDPMVCEFKLAYDYREQPPQQVGLSFQIATVARVLGLVIKYPLGMAKMDLDV
jgi:hypothetical protein